jgi:hypothetical protein
MLSTKEKRQRLISESSLLFLKNDPDWFKNIQSKIVKLIEGKDTEQRTEIVLKWIRECETMACPRVKEEIIKLFAQ